MLNCLKRLSYRPEPLKLAHRLGLNSILRRAYFYCARPISGILQTEVAGIQVQFYTHTPEELRILESGGGAGGEERVLSRLIEFLRPADVVLDIGANVGLYTVFLAKVVGRGGLLIACEPSSQSYAHLLQNLELNGLTNVRCFRKALGERNGQAWLSWGEVIGGSSLVHAGEGDGPGEMVEVIEGDRLVSAENLPVPRAVKIDVEGYEYAVIRGLRHTLAQQACELVCCEVHPARLPREIKPETVLDLLESFGFSRIETYPRWDETIHLLASKAAPLAEVRE
jgi:FkbM family methyltransferase